MGESIYEPDDEELLEGDTLFREPLDSNDEIFGIEHRVADEFERFYYLSRQYRDRANDLVAVAHDSIEGPENCVFTIVFLFRHAIELHLKQIIARGAKCKALAADEKRQYLTGHDLLKLWKKAEPVVRPYIGLEEVQLARLLRELNDADSKSDAFRYPFVLTIRPEVACGDDAVDGSVVRKPRSRA